MSWELHISGMNTAPVTHTIPAGASVVLGRAEDNDVVLVGAKVSRRHVQFTAADDGLRITDLGSRNGTMLNGRAIGAVPRLVRSGDVALVGDYRVKMVNGGDATRVVPDGFVTLMTGKLSDNPILGASRGDAMQSLYALAATLASGVTLKAFVQAALSAARRATRFEGGSVVIARDGRWEPLVPPPTPVLISRTIIGASVLRHATLFVRHLPSDNRFSTTESVVLARALHVVCVPLFAGTENVGALYLSTCYAEPPTQETIDFVTAVGQLVATAIAREERKAAQATEFSANSPDAGQLRFARDAAGELVRALRAYRHMLQDQALTDDEKRRLAELDESVGLNELMDELPAVLDDLLTRVQPAHVPRFGRSGIERTLTAEAEARVDD